MRRLSLLALGVGLAVLVTACGSSSSAPAPGGSSSGAGAAQPSAGSGAAPAAAPAVAGAPKPGGVLRIRNYSSPPTLDPHRTLCGCFTSSAHGLAYSRLLRFKTGDGIPPVSFALEGELAESWKQINDTTWEIKLKKGVKWQNLPPVNGRELVAQDVVYSLQRQKTPGWDNAELLSTIKTIEAPDASTVRLTLTAPDADILNRLADGHSKIIAKEAVDQANGDLINGPTITSGPWIVTEYQKDSVTKFKKNPDYFEKDEKGVSLPYIEAMESYIIRDDAARFAALRAKRVDIETAYPAWVKQLKDSNSPMKLQKMQSFGGKQFGLKVSKKPFDDQRVRQAIAIGWSREDARKAVYQDDAWFAVIPYMPGLDWVVPEAEVLKTWARDTAKAKKLLADAGFPNGFDTTFVVANYGNDYASQAQLMVQQWKEIGINATIQIIEPAVYTQRVLVEGNFDMFMGPYSPVPGPNSILQTLYLSGSNRNTSQIKDDKLDKMINDQVGMTDAAKRKESLLAIQRHVMDQSANYSVLQSLATTAWWPYLNNWSVATGAYEYQQYLKMWIDPSDPNFAGRP